MLRAGTYSTRVIAPAIAGILLAITQPIFVLCLSSAVLLLAFVSILTFKAAKDDTLSQTGAAKSSVIEKLRFATNFYRSNPKVGRGLAYLVFANFALAPLGIIVPLLVSEAFGRGAFALGIAETALGAGAILGALSASRIKGSLNNALGGVAMLFFVAFASAYMGTNWFGVFMLALFGVGLNVAAFGTKVDSLLMKDIPSSIYPKIVAIQSVLTGTAFPLGILVSSLFLHQENNYIYIPVFSALVSIAGMVVLYRLGRLSENLRAADAGRPARVCKLAEQRHPGVRFPER